MPPSSPSLVSSTMSPGRKATLEPLTTPMRTEIVQRERSQRIGSYSRALVLWAIAVGVLSIEWYFLDGWCLATLTRGLLPEVITSSVVLACLLGAVIACVMLSYSLVRETYPDRTTSTTVVSSPSPSLGPASPVTSSPLTGKETANATIFTTPQSQRQGSSRTSPIPLYGSTSPARPDCSWLDAHAFGDSRNPAKSPRSIDERGLSSSSPHSTSMTSSPLLSLSTFSPSASASPAAIGASILSDLSASSRAPFQAKIAALPSTKMMTSIHTQEQVDLLLAKSREEAAAGAASASDARLNESSSFYQAMLHLDGLELHPYQMSREAAGSKSDPYDVIYDNRGGVHLSPRLASPLGGSGSDEATRFRVELAAQRAAAAANAQSSSSSSPYESRRRRLSHHHSQSPSRDVSSSGTDGSGSQTDSAQRRRGDSFNAGALLSDAELTRAEQRMRVWLVNTIVRPLNDGIRTLNKRLETDLSALHLRVGVSSSDALSAAITAHPDLISTTLPHILPYLRVHANQAYLVSRLAALSVGSCMADFSWASGGPQPLTDDKSSSSASSSSYASSPSRLSARPWTDALPTDTQLVLSLFATYMDARVSSSALVQTHNVDQPFTARYTLINPAKPTALHQSSGSFYIHLASLNPPSLEFVAVTSEGVSTITSRSLFGILAHFIAHAKWRNDGRIDRLALSDPAINLDVVVTGR